MSIQYLAAAAAAGLAVIVYSVIVLATSDSSAVRIRGRLDTLEDRTDMEYIHKIVLSEKKKKRKERAQIHISTVFEEYLASSGITVSAQKFIAFWIGLTVLPGILGSMMGLQIIAIMGISIVGFAVPPVMVKRSKDKRQQMFNKQLSEALAIMSNCLRSGYSFQQALESIAREMSPPISEEFSRVIREVNYGVSLEDALHKLVRRTGSKDLELLVSAVLTSMQVGANLSEILDTIAETVNDRIKLREEVKVFSAQGRMSGIIIGILPIIIILILMVINPTYFNGFLEHPIGKILLIVSGIMEAIGYFLINRIADVRY